MTALLNWRVWAAIVAAVALAASHWKVYKVGQNDIRTEWQADQLDTARQTLRLLEKNAATTTALQDNADTLRRTKNAQITRLNADLAAALAGLQNRPDRPSAGSVPTDTGTGPNPGCTGAQLYKSDAGFLSREADRAERLLADVAQCQAALDKARAAVNK
jgi:hypothetical protein